MSDESHRSLSGWKYISLETYRRNGVAVRTPVWFAEADRVLYVYSLANAGKVKRIRTNPGVRVAPCDLRGNLQGDWLEAEARVVDGDEEKRGHALLNQKYWPWKPMGDFFSRLRSRRQAILVVRLL
ncbi:MAG: PPOX class F420-dependent oxidoreductase [Acidobacteria bacterium]|nr:PPOX class F420-dependent oxidoreductase [Acidobacteriota bacterium]